MTVGCGWWGGVGEGCCVGKGFALHILCTKPLSWSVELTQFLIMIWTSLVSYIQLFLNWILNETYYDLVRNIYCVTPTPHHQTGRSTKNVVKNVLAKLLVDSHLTLPPVRWRIYGFVFCFSFSTRFITRTARKINETYMTAYTVFQPSNVCESSNQILTDSYGTLITPNLRKKVCA